MHRRIFLATMGACVGAGCSESSDDPVTSTSDRSASPRTTETPTTRATTTSSSRRSAPLRGVSLSPRSYGEDDFSEFLERVSEADFAVRWAGDWAELGREDSAPTVVARLSEGYDYPVVIDAGVYSVGESQLNRPLDEETLANYVESAGSFAEQFEPAYMGFGVEVNIHAEDQPAEFETFVSLFEETYDAVKAVSPDTQVYTTFQLEWLMGLRGGQFGGTNDPEQAQWELLDRFPKADLVGITTYPGLVYQNPSDVPDDHYAGIADRTDRPLAVTETGWAHSNDAGPDWETSEDEQAAFVRRLFELTADLDLALLLWLFVYQPSGVEQAFEAMSLRRDDGTARPAWDAWVEGPP